MRANSAILGGEAHEAMGITFQKEQAALETLTASVSRGSTSKPIGSDEGLSLPFHAPSFKGDSKSPF